MNDLSQSLYLDLNETENIHVPCISGPGMAWSNLHGHASQVRPALRSNGSNTQSIRFRNWGNGSWKNKTATIGVYQI